MGARGRVLEQEFAGGRAVLFLAGFWGVFGCSFLCLRGASLKAAPHIYLLVEFLAFLAYFWVCLVMGGFFSYGVLLCVFWRVVLLNQMDRMYRIVFSGCGRGP